VRSSDKNEDGWPLENHCVCTYLWKKPRSSRGIVRLLEWEIAQTTIVVQDPLVTTVRTSSSRDPRSKSDERSMSFLEQYNRSSAPSSRVSSLSYVCVPLPSRRSCLCRWSVFVSPMRIIEILQEPRRKPFFLASSFSAEVLDLTRKLDEPFENRSETI
jgi:hypothetical protein